MIVQAGSADQPARIEAQVPPAAPAAPAAPASPAVVVGENPAPGVITIQRGGKTITIDGATGTTIGGGRGGDGGGTTSGTEFPFPTDIPPGVQSIATTAIVGFCMMVAAYPVFGFLKALVNRNALRQNALPSRDTTDRLQRIEAAVEAMSVEVERISEGQRFVTRVLSERSSAQS
jgi:hypothetical protein